VKLRHKEKTGQTRRTKLSRRLPPDDLATRPNVLEEVVIGQVYLCLVCLFLTNGQELVKLQHVEVGKKMSLETSVANTRFVSFAIFPEGFLKDTDHE